MPGSDYNEESNLNNITKKVLSLENRINRIEELLNQYNIQTALRNPAGSVIHESPTAPEDQESGVESKVVEYGLAWLSSLIYLLGVIFLSVIIKNSGHRFYASLVGFAAAAAVFLLTYFLRKPFPHLVFVLTISGLLLLYYVTLRLYYFEIEPVVTSQWLVIFMLFSVLAYMGYYSLRKESEFLAILVIMLILISGIIMDAAPLTLPCIFISAIVALLYFSKFGWWKLLFFGIFLTYLSHLIWLLNNPFMGHSLQAVSSPQNSLFYLFLYVITFSVAMLLSRKKTISDSIYGMIAFTNVIDFILLLSLEVIVFYNTNYVWIFLLLAALSMIFSILLKSRTDKLFTPAFYACFSFLALSVGIYGYLKLPDAYLFLAVQSLLVVSIALWYRSKIIVVVNTFLFLIILAVYLIFSPSKDSINFTFAIIALTTARILNWQKERLTLKTDIFRIIYLVEGFVMVLFGLSEAISAQFVTLSWMIAAIFFLVMSILLKNNRYRWISIITILFTGLHLLLVDMAKLEIEYRVIAFLFFAAITLGISLYYSKRIKKIKADK